MSAEGYLIHKNYRANLEHGVWVWSRIMKKKFVGKHPDSGKNIMIEKSGVVGTNNEKMRCVTNATDYDEAVKMPDRWLERPKKEKKHAKAPGQTDLLSAIKEAQKENIIDMMNDDQKSGLYE